MRPGGGKNKGSAFEREICKTLSLWWTDGVRDDIFWRTASSGGRATQRSKRGKGTHGAAGDICALDPIGQPLMDLITLELKCGYPTARLDDLVERPAGKNLWRQWIEQAERSAVQARTPYWGIIRKRSGREVMLVAEDPFFELFHLPRSSCMEWSANSVAYRAVCLDYFLAKTDSVGVRCLCKAIL
jgi:hypothetical protein